MHRSPYRKRPARRSPVKLNHGTDAGSYEPYTSYRLGDTVALNVPGSYANAPSQVVGLTIAKTPNADYSVEANLGSIALPIEAATGADARGDFRHDLERLGWGSRAT